MHNDGWSASRVAAALARLEDAGYPQPQMARLAGVSQSTVNRWSHGKVQPGYGTVWRLAAAVWRRHPELARELVEASGYAWAEPQDAPEPESLIPPEVLAALESAYADDPELLRRAVEAQEAIASERRSEGLSRRRRPAG